MLSLYLVRHGQTDCSVRDVLCGGGCDPDLTAAGRQTAEALAAHLALRPWAGLYTSPLARAQQTLAPVAAGQAARVEAGLAEINYGDWDGKSEADLCHDDAFAKFRIADADLRPPGGETLTEVADRAEQAIRGIAARHPQGDVLGVSHKTTIRVLLCRLLGIPLSEDRRRIACPLGGITVLSLRAGGAQLMAHGLVEHLPVGLREGR